MPKTTTTQGEPSPKASSKTVCFRLDENMFSVLQRRAELLKTSPHELARFYVFEALHHGVELETILDHLSQIYDDVNKVRGDVATAAEALMVATEHCTPEQARKWASEVFT